MAARAGIEYVRAPAGPLPPPARRDARGARGALRRGARAGRARRAACSSGRRWTSGHRHDRPAALARRARAWRSCRAAPLTWTDAAALLDAAELRGRSGRGHPRGHPAHRQDRSASSSACSGHSDRGEPAASPRHRARSRPRTMSRRRRRARRRGGAASPRAGGPRAPPAAGHMSGPTSAAPPRIDEPAALRGRRPEGGPLARARRCRCARARRCRTRCCDSATRWWRSTWVRARGAAARGRPDVAFVALHGRDGEDGTIQGLLEAIGVPYTGSGPAACMRCTDKVLAKHLMREAGIPTPDFHAFKESAIKELGAAAALAGRGAQARLPDGRQAREPGLGAGREVRAHERGAAAGARGGVLLRPHGADRALREGSRPGGVGPRPTIGPAAPWRCRSSRRSRARRTSTTTSRATRSA